MAIWEAPTHCPVGHELRVGNVTRSWTACDCALAPRPSNAAAGHDYVRCWTCKREIRENGCKRLVDGLRVTEPPPPWAATGPPRP